jgi:bifunctional non-homologous end joining protein LigD
MTDEQAPTGTALARAVLADLRPQDFGRGNPSHVSNPLVEPLWSGLRVLAAIDGGGVAIVDEDGDAIDGFDAIVEALSGSSAGSELVIDGIITKQATRTSVSVVAWSDEMPSMASMVGLRRNRATDSIKLKETAYADATFDPADSIALVVTDLLWLDETSLLDVPLMERRRLLEAVVVESDAIRIGAFVRPPIERWINSWRAQGFQGMTFKAANSRYLPGRPNPEWVIAGMPRR